MKPHGTLISSEAPVPERVADGDVTYAFVG